MTKRTKEGGVVLVFPRPVDGAEAARTRTRVAAKGRNHVELFGYRVNAGTREWVITMAIGDGSCGKYFAKRVFRGTLANAFRSVAQFQREMEGGAGA
jgi:hypothetical protein